MALKPGNGKTEDEKQDDKISAADEVAMREIDDAVRQQELEDFAQKYGKPILGLVVAGLLAFGGYLFWNSQSESGMEKSSEELVAVLDQIKSGNLDDADSRAAALAAENSGASAAAARMLRGGIAQEQGKSSEAAALFAEVAGDDDAPPVLRDLATIREMSANFDERDPAEVIARLKALAVPGNPWFGSAGELVAMAYLEQGKKKEAGTMFAEIAKAEDTPESLKARARQMAGILGVDAIEDVDELLESQGVETASSAEEQTTAEPAE